MLGTSSCSLVSTNVVNTWEQFLKVTRPWSNTFLEVTCPRSSFGLVYLSQHPQSAYSASLVLYTYGRGQTITDVWLTQGFLIEAICRSVLTSYWGKVIGNNLSCDAKSSHKIAELPSSSQVWLLCLSEKRRCRSFIFLQAFFSESCHWSC